MINLNWIINNFFEIIADKVFKNAEYGSLQVTFPSGKIKNFNTNNNKTNADIKLNNFSMIIKILKKGSLGFAESYMDGDFSTNNLTNLLFFAEQNHNNYINYNQGIQLHKLLNRFFHYLNKNTKSKSKKNIRHHYDLGNQFYELWLDKSMTYSSGLFELPYDDLSKAQLNKYRKIISPMRLNDNSSLLEIGCGWGGFATYVAKNYKSKINAITNSKQQFEYTSKKICEEGLNEKVTIQLKDYRDINEKYDYISSIEMFEAVGIEYWPVYFNKIKNCLKNNGLATLQIITISERKKEFYQKNPDFIQQYIFPGGVLPSKKQLYEITSSIGMKLYELNSFGNSYASTLSLWNEQFQNAWTQIAQQGFSKRFKRMWEYYLSYSEVGFKTRSTDVSQFLLK